ncbi:MULTISPECIES: SDR family oxidoreductase [Vibrio]|uniref:SDR family oxidoreductase n=1 Tax=Vibrio TaxID=662 RepID=UPI00107F2A85|nr:SDR family oxidoreductase [Vibrio tasmaniensis]
MVSKIALVGATSSIGKALSARLDSNEFELKKYSRNSEELTDGIQFDANNINGEYIERLFEKKYDIYIFSLGLLIPKKISEQSENEIISSLKVNAIFIVKAIEYILNSNGRARVIIIGSESGRKGSYDTSYFLSKSMLRAYVRQRGVGENQQLLLLSPSTIEDSQMTQSRKDTEVVNKHRENHPKKRFLHMEEVTDVIFYLISNDSTYLTNTEIEINGGKFCRMR